MFRHNLFFFNFSRLIELWHVKLCSFDPQWCAIRAHCFLPHFLSSSRHSFSHGHIVQRRDLFGAIGHDEELALHPIYVLLQAFFGMAIEIPGIPLLLGPFGHGFDWYQFRTRNSQETILSSPLRKLIQTILEMNPMKFTSFEAIFVGKLF